MQLTSIKLIVRGAKASAEVHGDLTAGMVGIPVTIEYDDSWNGLSKNLVCRGGLGYEKFKGESRTILGVGTAAKVAPEVMIAGEVLYLGIEGYNVDGSLVIPTTWACCGTIQEGVKTEGGPTEDPTLPIWEQLQARIDQFPETIDGIIEEKLQRDEFRGEDGNGIKSAVLNSDDTLTLNFDDGTSYTTPSIRGEPGKDYVLTEADKNEIAEQAAELVDLSDFSTNSDCSNLCIMDVTDGWASIGKTYGEIQEAYDSGAILILSHSGHEFNLVSAGNGFVFERNYVEGTKLVTDRCTLDEDMIFHVPRASVLDTGCAIKTVNGVAPDENGNVEIVFSDKEEKEYTSELSISGFVRANGSGIAAATDNAFRTDYISTDGVVRIYGNAGFCTSCMAIAFYDVNKTLMESISVTSSSLITNGTQYDEGTFELDISGDAYGDAAYFIVSTYRLASRPDLYTQAFSDDFCKYVKLEEVTEEEPAYRIGKNTIVFFGDSITSGAGEGDYPSLIAEITGATVENHGVSGSTLATETSATHHICSDVAAYTGTADIICVSGGLNDYNQNVPIGLLSDGYSAELDTTSVIGALESILRNLLSNHTEAKVYYVIAHKAASSEVNSNALGLTFRDYHDAIVSVLRKYSIPFFDAFSQSGLVTSAYGAWGESIRSLYTVNADGVHPNREGYLKYYVYPIIAMMEDGTSSGDIGTANIMPLTFTGAVNAVYNGTEAVNVNIPIYTPDESGSGGVLESETILSVTTEERVSFIRQELDNPKKYKYIVIQALGVCGHADNNSNNYAAKVRITFESGQSAEFTLSANMTVAQGTTKCYGSAVAFIAPSVVVALCGSSANSLNAVSMAEKVHLPQTYRGDYSGGVKSIAIGEVQGINTMETGATFHVIGVM